MGNKVLHSMKGRIVARTRSGRYMVIPEDSVRMEAVPFPKFHRCSFPGELLDEKGFLKNGAVIELVRVGNGWIYPNHKVYLPCSSSDSTIASSDSGMTEIIPREISDLQ